MLPNKQFLKIKEDVWEYSKEFFFSDEVKNCLKKAYLSLPKRVKGVIEIKYYVSNMIEILSIFGVPNIFKFYHRIKILISIESAD